MAPEDLVRIQCRQVRRISGGTVIEIHKSGVIGETAGFARSSNASTDSGSTC